MRRIAVNAPFLPKTEVFSSDSSSSKPESEPSSSSSVPSEDKPAESSDTSSATDGEDGEPMD